MDAAPTSPARRGLIELYQMHERKKYSTSYPAEDKVETFISQFFTSLVQAHHCKPLCSAVLTGLKGSSGASAGARASKYGVQCLRIKDLAS
jgi:hypothetical protein